MIIGIGGVSRSGKTTLANQLRNQLGINEVKIISQDDFTYPQSDLPIYNGIVDWEHPDGIDFSALKKTLIEQSKKYTHLIVEGFLIYHSLEIRSLIDFKIFITINKNTFLNRKAEDNRWGETPSSYISYIWDSYLKFGTIDNISIDLLLKGSEPFKVAAITREIVKRSKNNHS
ncbi:MAG: AAA family ATPase [Fulvivirga sp.]|uniref:AAA family ATPase n=1 Tax=Fulvivirga sp. TaxID=1931237 RepID=UPI0032EF8F5D